MNTMNQMWKIAGLVAWSSCASVVAESFDAGTAGWTAADARCMTVSHRLDGRPGGSLAGAFGAQPIPVPVSDSFVAPAGFVNAQLAPTGDLRRCVLGFDFRSGSTKPTTLRLRIGDASNRQISRFLNSMISQPGVWYSFRLSLADLRSWVGDVQDAAEILRNVASLAVDLTRNGEGEETYQLDNIFVDALPAAGDVAGAGPTSLRWENLRQGDVYRVEGTVSLDPAAWETIETLQADAPVHFTELTDQNEFRFFRLVIP